MKSLRRNHPGAVTSSSSHNFWVRGYSLLYPLFLSSLLFAQNIPDTLPRSSLPESIPLYERSPGRAILFSTLLPGGGQFYTENYIKGTIFLFGEGALFYFTLKEKDRDKRSNFIWWTAAVHIFNIADAYVSAHFYKFKQNKRISLFFSPARISLALKLP